MTLSRSGGEAAIGLVSELRLLQREPGLEHHVT